MFFNKSKENKVRIKKEKLRYVKICPRCQSINVKISNQGGSAGIVFGAPTVYRCLDCGYSNYAFPEIDVNKLQNKLKNKRKEIKEE